MTTAALITELRAARLRNRREHWQALARMAGMPFVPSDADVTVDIIERAVQNAPWAAAWELWRVALADMEIAAITLRLAKTVLWPRTRHEP